MPYFENVNEQILNAIPLSAKRILEVGCANGNLGKAVKQRQSCEYVGVEMNTAAADVARGQIDIVINADVESLDFSQLGPEPFDVIVFGDVLEHFRKPEEVLAALRAHLEPTGQIIANVPNVGHYMVILGLLEGKFEYTDDGLLDRTHLTFFTPDSFRAMLWDAGFHVVSELPTYVQSPVCQNIGDFAKSLGFSGEKAFSVSCTYQTLFSAKLNPNPNTDEAVREQLMGPHRGKLGQSSCRASIIIVTYNSSSTIDECFESLLLRISDAEIIVVDNDSSDDTVEILKEWAAKDARIQIIRSESNLGFSKGNNVGILASSGEFIVLLNPDTVVTTGWLDRMCDVLSDQAVGAVGPLSDQVSGKQFVGAHLPSGYRPPTSELPDILRRTAPGVTERTKLLIGFCIGFRRSTLDQVGLLDETLFLGSDDLEMSWRLRSLGYELRICKDTIVFHKQGASFATVQASSVNQLVKASDEALLAKLRRYYKDIAIKSQLIWDSAIFSPVCESEPSLHIPSVS